LLDLFLLINLISTIR